MHLTTNHVVVDANPAHALNTFSPVRAFGAGVDAQNNGAPAKIYTPANVKEMLSAGLGPVTYRLYTELSVQDWHWNPSGSWSQSGNQGYFTGNASPGSQTIGDSYGYRLPHRGFTTDNGNNDDYSRLDDGNLSTYWKSDPYLDQAYTGESNSLHPGWVLVDLGSKKPVDAISIAWTNPYASNYAVQYWTGDDALFDPANGAWVTFPNGTVTNGAGGTVVLSLTSSPKSVRYVRVLMTVSSGTCDTHGSGDPRDCVGFAIDEMGVGTLNGKTFNDLVVHKPNNGQTKTYASSVDPWHASTNEVTDEEQAGLDRVFMSGLTRGVPAVVPVAMLYGTPDDAAAEIRYLEARGYMIGSVELGEEPDGQEIVPEDYAALYVEWSTALHAVDPNLHLGGPVFQGTNSDTPAWPNQNGNTSWLNRFLAYLSAHGAESDLAFMSFEHYPFAPCQVATEDNLIAEPGLVSGIVKTWRADGVPATTPLLITETNYSANTTEHFQDISGALWFSDLAGSFMSAGGSSLYLYEYEPDPLFDYSHCPAGRGSWGMWNATPHYTVKQPTSQYFAAQLLTQQWADPVDETHTLFPATTDVLDGKGREIVTAYAVERPDGQWAVMLVNKDPSQAYSVQVTFNLSGGPAYFQSPVAAVTLSPKQYVWKPAKRNGSANPDGPPATASVNGGPGATYTLPASSVVVLRATLPGSARRRGVGTTRRI
jgi:hypothetical protein